MFTGREVYMARSAFTKQHYDLIAQAVREAPIPKGHRLTVARTLAGKLAAENENFKEDHFIAVATEPLYDLEIQNEGTIFLVHPRTELGIEWIAENVGKDGTLWHGHALVVEPRYIAALVEGAREAGLQVT